MSQQARHVIFRVPRTAGDDLVLAEIAGGQLCIVDGDEPVARCLWAASDLPEAVSTFQAMKARLLARPPLPEGPLAMSAVVPRPFVAGAEKPADGRT